VGPRDNCQRDIQSSMRSMVEEAGASGFINKPFAADQVLNAASAALREGTNGAD